MLTRLAKQLGTLAIVVLVFVYVQYRSPFTTVSPDSVRFMHFWQSNISLAGGGGPLGVAKAICTALVSANAYDGYRGRFAQIAIYGIDGLTRWMFPRPAVNLWMMLLIGLNSGLIAWTSTRTVSDPSARENVFCLAWLVLTTSALTISPVLLLILYGKYVWMTFVTAFFVSRRTGSKLIWLVLAALADEIGLFSVLLILWLNVVRFFLNRMPGELWCGRSSLVRTSRACSLATLASLTGLFTYYGVWAVLLNTGAGTFRGFAHSSPFRAKGIWNMVYGLLWRAEGLIVGLPLGHIFINCFFGLVVLVVVIAGVWKSAKIQLGHRRGENRRLDDRLAEWLRDEPGFFYSFWIGMLLLIAVLILPGGGGDLTHYSYPAAAVLSVLAIRALVDVLSVRRVYAALTVVLGFHLFLLPRTVAATSSVLETYLFPDRTVGKEDIEAINTSVTEFRAKGHSPRFQALNNGQDLDLSGTWFYSRIKGYGSTSGPHFPVQGTVRVLLWPYTMDLR
jgi:hypothetical protein